MGGGSKVSGDQFAGLHQGGVQFWVRHRAERKACVVGRSARSPDWLARIAHGQESLPRLDALAWSHFEQHLRRERRLSDRTGAPLSLVLFGPAADCVEKTDWEQRMLEVVRTTTRDTDIVGPLGNDRVAILLPDTDQRGLGALVQKVAAQTNAPAFAEVHATYPERLFEQVLSDRPNEDDSVRVLAARSRAPDKYPGKRMLDILAAAASLLVRSLSGPGSVRN